MYHFCATSWCASLHVVNDGAVPIAALSRSILVGGGPRRNRASDSWREAGSGQTKGIGRSKCWPEPDCLHHCAGAFVLA